MSPTVHELQNSIRDATGRFEREFEASFTKEELQAICAALEVGVEASGRPSKAQMRKSIRAQVGIAGSRDAADESPFRKADLRTIADALGASSEE